MQLKIKHVGWAVERPGKELRGFDRVSLQAGETKTVTLTVLARRPASWNTTSRSWVVEDDKVQPMVGPSSAEKKLDRTINVTE